MRIKDCGIVWDVNLDCSKCQGTGVDEEQDWKCENGEHIACTFCHGTGMDCQGDGCKDCECKGKKK